MHSETIKLVADLLRRGLDRPTASPVMETAKWSGDMKNEVAGLATILDRSAKLAESLLVSEVPDTDGRSGAWPHPIAKVIIGADNSRPTRLEVGPLIMDLIDRRVCRGSRQLSLLPREFDLLEYFMRHPNKVIMRATLLSDIWHYVRLPETNVIDVHIGKLRHKVDLPAEIQLFHTVRGVGFALRDGRKA